MDVCNLTLIHIANSLSLGRIYRDIYDTFIRLILSRGTNLNLDTNVNLCWSVGIVDGAWSISLLEGGEVEPEISNISVASTIATDFQPEAITDEGALGIWYLFHGFSGGM